MDEELSGLNEWMKSRGYPVGYQVKTAGEWSAITREFLKDKSGSFQPQTGNATNAATGDVVRYFTSSPNSAQVLPEERFKEGPIDEKGQQLVFDPAKGDYFPATNRATKAPVKPKAKATGPSFVMGPDGRPMFMPDSMTLPEATPTPAPASVAPMGAGVYETNLPTPVSAPNLSPMAMGAGTTMGMTPMPQAAAPTVPAAAAPAAPAAMTSPEQIRAAFQAGQITEADALRLLRGGR